MKEKESDIEFFTVDENEVDLLSDEETKVKIREMIKNNPGLDAWDISCELSLSAERCVRLCDELMDEGKIEPILGDEEE